MSPKTIITALLIALVAIVLFFNKEESSFWFFGEIRTSKLLILAVFYILGVITGSFLFRRRKKHPKEYGITNPSTSTEANTENNNPYATSNLSDEDRDFIRRD